jgi:hypothetical protein
MRDNDVIEGASQGMESFLYQHPISVVEPMLEKIAEVVAKEVRTWLEINKDEILDKLSVASIVIAEKKSEE